MGDGGNASVLFPGSSLYSSSTTVVEGGDVVLVKVVERERERVTLLCWEAVAMQL